MKKVKDLLLGALWLSPWVATLWFIAFHIEDVGGRVTIVYTEGDLLHLVLRVFGVVD